MNNTLERLQIIVNIHRILNEHLASLHRLRDIEFVNTKISDILNDNNYSLDSLKEINTQLEIAHLKINFYKRTRQFELSDSLKNKTCDMVLEELKNLVIKKIVGN